MNENQPKVVLTATHVNYYHVCHRKLWLFAQQITMEQTSDLVYEGKLIGEESYAQRAERYRELQIEGIKIDHFDAKNRVVREVKKSNKLEPAHIAQLKYYLFVLEVYGLTELTGILEYPTLRKTQTVLLTEEDRAAIPLWIADIERIVASEVCPPVIHKKFCKTCSYYEFCYV